MYIMEIWKIYEIKLHFRSDNISNWHEISPCLYYHITKLNGQLNISFGNTFDGFMNLFNFIWLFFVCFVSGFVWLFSFFLKLFSVQLISQFQSLISKTSSVHILNCMKFNLLRNSSSICCRLLAHFRFVYCESGTHFFSKQTFFVNLQILWKFISDVASPFKRGF